MSVAKKSEPRPARTRRGIRSVATPPAIRLYVLGETRVETEHGTVERAWLAHRPGQLLRYLVCNRGRAVTGDEIIEALWPGAMSGPENVRYLVHLLRRRLEPDRPRGAQSAAVECSGGAYSLGRDVWIDAQEFEDRVLAGLSAAGSGDDEPALARLQSALELYRGDFLADEPYADWAMAERERLHGTVEAALTAAISICERRHEHLGALDYARVLAYLDPFDSDVQLQVIRLCLACGRRSEATRRYGAFRSRLLREFGQEPEFDLASAAASSDSVVSELSRPRAVFPLYARGMR